MIKAVVFLSCVYTLLYLAAAAYRWLNRRSNRRRT